VADTDVNELAAMVSGIAAGDPRAWNALVERYAPLVWSIVRAYRLTPSEAEDVTQNVWLALLQVAKELREPAALPGWLATTARREALRAVRRRARTHDLGIAEETEQLMDTNPTPEEMVEADKRIAALNRAIRQLPERCRTLLSVLLITPSYAEISAALSMPVGSLGPTRVRCLNHLRRLLAEGDGMTETELLERLRGSQLSAGEVPATVIDKANAALAARPKKRDSNTPEL